VFLQDCFDPVDDLRVLLPKDLVRDGGREHMTGDVPGRSGKGQYGKREKYKGATKDTVASYAISDKRQGKRHWTTSNEPQ